MKSETSSITEQIPSQCAHSRIKMEKNISHLSSTKRAKDQKRKHSPQTSQTKEKPYSSVKGWSRGGGGCGGLRCFDEVVAAASDVTASKAKGWNAAVPVADAMPAAAAPAAPVPGTSSTAPPPPAPAPPPIPASGPAAGGGGAGVSGSAVAALRRAATGLTFDGAPWGAEGAAGRGGEEAGGRGGRERGELGRAALPEAKRAPAGAG